MSTVLSEDPFFFFQKKKIDKKLVGIKERKGGQYDAPPHTFFFFVRGNKSALPGLHIFKQMR